MARFRFRMVLPDGRPVILKPEADNLFAAAAIAERQLREQKLDPSVFESATAKVMKAAKGAVYIGEARKKAPKKPAPAPAAATTGSAPAPAAAAAKPAAQSSGKGR